MKLFRWHIALLVVFFNSKEFTLFSLNTQPLIVDSDSVALPTFVYANDVKDVKNDRVTVEIKKKRLQMDCWLAEQEFKLKRDEFEFNKGKFLLFLIVFIISVFLSAEHSGL